MTPSTTIRLKGLKLITALALCLGGFSLLMIIIFSSQIVLWLDSHLFLSLTASLLLLAAGSLLFFRSSSNEKTYTIQHIEGLSISYTPEAVIDVLGPLFENLFPGKEVKKDVLFHKGNVHIFVDLPYHPKDEQQELLKTIERELKGTLNKFFSYNSDFLLVTSFQESPS